jgi:hypothetical protein
MSFMRAIVLLAALFFTAFSAACGNKPNFMQYDVVFYAPLGTNATDIGCNIPFLTNMISEDNSFAVGDNLDVPTGIQISRNRLFLADKYNRRVSIFPLVKGPTNNNFIPPAGNGYSFGIPYQVLLNKYGEIFVLASVSNFLPDFSTRTNDEGNIEVVKSKESTNYFQYYIYKFSPEGKFVFQIGENGIHSGPMEYPERIDVDLFDNLYAYYKDYENDRAAWIVKRFSPSGELSFEFNTKYISATNTVGDKTYIGLVSDVYNLKNDERLMIYSENYLIKRGQKVFDTPDEYYHSIDVYSVLQNAITRNVMNTKKYLDEFNTITKDDVLVLFSYDEKFKGVRFRFLDIGAESRKEEVYYAPVISDNYVHIQYYVDDTGQIYSIIVKDNAYFVILKWRKVQSRPLS